MSKQFDVAKTLNLGFLGEGWDQCNIKFRALSMEELRETLASGKETDTDNPDIPTILASINDRAAEVKTHFVSGQGISGGQTVDLEADDLDALPAEVVAKAWAVISGTPDPNSPTPSTSS